MGAAARGRARAQEADPDRREQSPVHRQAGRAQRGVRSWPGVDCPGWATEGSLMAAEGWRDHPRIDAVSAWIVANVTRIWGVVLFAIVLALSWHALRGIHTREVRAVL